jgi:hypothetical protein
MAEKHPLKDQQGLSLRSTTVLIASLIREKVNLAAPSNKGTRPSRIRGNFLEYPSSIGRHQLAPI